MKEIQITDEVYDRLKSMADEQGEMIEAMACYYLQRGMGELDRINEQTEIYKAEAEFYDAALKCTQPMTRH